MPKPFISTRSMVGLRDGLEQRVGSGTSLRALRESNLPDSALDTRRADIPQPAQLLFLDRVARDAGVDSITFLLGPFADIQSYGAFGDYVVSARTLGDAPRVTRDMMAFRLSDRLSLRRKGDTLRLTYHAALRHFDGYAHYSAMAVAVVLSIARPFLADRFQRRRLSEHGSSPRDLTRTIRLDRARELLAETDLDVIEIAQRVGYSDPSHFGRAFRQSTGMTPSDARGSLRRALDTGARPAQSSPQQPQGTEIAMKFETDAGPAEFPIDAVIVAGWTGRDAAAVQHHIDELAAIGVPAPSTVPLFYRVSNTLLMNAPQIEVLGSSTSGEAEPMLVRRDGRYWLGLGSDHTDRDLEAVSVAASKQACPKPCATKLWAWESVADHVDGIRVQSWIRENGDWSLYQDGTLGQILPLQHLIESANMTDGSAMLCGTFAAIGGVRPSGHFRALMQDPATGREIQLEYQSRCLPIVR